MNHLEEHYAAVTAALAALEAGGAGASMTLQPLHAREHLERLVRGCTPSDALEEDSFAKSEVTVNGSFAKFQEPFAATDDPFAPSDAHNAKDAFGAFPAADPFAGDAFAPNNTSANDSAWESDPFAVLHAPTRPLANTANTANAANPSANVAAKRHKTPPPRPAPPRPLPPHKNDRKPALDFTEDPFKDYRYEDPFNIDDPFADVADPGRNLRRPTSVAAFASDDFFPPVNGRAGGRASAPPARDRPDGLDAWAAWPDDTATWGSHGATADTTIDGWADKTDSWTNKNDSWANKNDNWANKNDNWTNKTENWSNKTDNWANETDNWAVDWDSNANASRTDRLEETWPATTLPAKKEKSPRPVKYAKSLVHTIGGIGRSRHKDKKTKENKEAKEVKADASEERQWAWAEAESRRLQREADARRRREDSELQLALALSRREQ